MRFVSAKPGYLKAALKIDTRHVNNHNVCPNCHGHAEPRQTIHGGVILGVGLLPLFKLDTDPDQLTDTLTSLALSTLGYHPTGVSVNVSTEFVRPGGKIGDELVGVGEVVKMGERGS